jgi:hypothetical protein
MTGYDQSKVLKNLSIAIMSYVEEYCDEHKIEDVDVILTGIGIAMSCLLDGSYKPEERVVQAKKAAEVLIRCAENGLEADEEDRKEEMLN